MSAAAGRPPIRPGKPGDLVMILETTWATLQEVKARDERGESSMEEVDEACHGIARALGVLIAEWLGIEEAAEVGDG